MDLSGANVVVMGLGASGRAAAKLAASAGATVVGVDLRTAVQPIEGVRLELGPHRRETFLEADLVVVSPGIPARVGHLVAAQEAGIRVLGELAFAWEFLDDPVAIAVTGTNGKSSVTWFTGQLLIAAGMEAFVGGNLGRPLSEAVLAGERPDVYVIEVSSYQMELPGSFSPKVGILLNLAPDHLRRHGTMEGYAAAKARIFERMTSSDLALLPAGDALAASACEGVGEGRRVHLGALPGGLRTGRSARIDIPEHCLDLDLSELSIPGAHNLDNALAAAMLSLAVGAAPEAIQAAIGGLQPLAHRMEIVADTHGVLWINDSKATNVDATRVGISGLARSAVVLLGGEAKDGGGFDALAPELTRHRAVVTFGQSGDEIADELATVGITARRTDSMEDAVDLARTLAREGDAVLLSPGCASFDAFDDFEHRGSVFRALVTGGDR